MTYPFARRLPAFQIHLWGQVDGLIDRHPDMIYFGNGSPAAELVPVERLREASTLAWADAPGMLNYGEVPGYRPLRELISARMAVQGMVADPDSLIVTHGSQQGIDLVCRLMLDPGDTIVVEGPTFIDALHDFEAYEPTYLTIPVDDDGMDVAALERALADGGAVPKFIYTIPTFQNPTGVTMSLARREALLGLARRYGILVVEDDPYGELRYSGEPVPPLRALDPGVVYLGTFSKVIAPALRVGWMALPAALLSPFASAKEAADNCNDRIMTRTIYHASRDYLDGHIAFLREAYRRRRDTLLAGLRQHMPAGARWVEPAGGFFVWIELPAGCDAADLLPIAAERGVLFLPGAWFYPRQEVQNELRLSFSALPEAAIPEGARRLGEAVTTFLR